MEKSTPQDVDVEERSSLSSEGGKLQITISQVVSKFRWGCFWAIMVSMCVVMEGYDLVLIQNFYAQNAFNAKFGTCIGEGADRKCDLSASWQAGLGNAPPLGCFVGGLLAGYLGDIWGKKKVILGSLLWLSAAVFGTFFAPNALVLLISEFLCGIPLGAFAVIAPAYSSEMLPLELRGYFTTYTNACFIMGLMVASGVTAALSGWESEWSFRIPFALQWAWPAILFPLLCFAPETPWHFVRHNKLKEAEKSFKRTLRSTAHETIDVEAKILEMKRINNHEMEMSAGTTYWDCFKGIDRRRTLLGCLAFSGNCLSGTPFAYHRAYFLKTIGIPQQKIYIIHLGGAALSLFSAAFNWLVLLPRFGRRPLYLWGMSTMSCILLTTGILQIGSHNGGGNRAWAQTVLTLVWTWIQQCTAGPLSWCIPAEIGSTRLRQKTIAVSRNCYYIVQIASYGIQPFFLNQAKLDLKGYVGFIWAGSAAIYFFAIFFCLPETKGRDVEDLDIMFENKVASRKFTTYDVTVAKQELARERAEKAESGVKNE